jgi:hypothetical protein
VSRIRADEDDEDDDDDERAMKHKRQSQSGAKFKKRATPRVSPAPTPVPVSIAASNDAANAYTGARWRRDLRQTLLVFVMSAIAYIVVAALVASSVHSWSVT